MGSIPLKGSYSASRVSAIIRLNPYTTPLHIFQILKEELEPGWNKKHGYALPIFTDNAATRWGHAFEDAVIKLAEEREGIPIVEKENLFKKWVGKQGSSDDITLSCHIDGRFSPYSGIILHEGKTTNTRAFYSIKEEIEDAIDEDGQILKGFKLVKRWGEPGTCETPLEYQVQCAVQRICTGAELVKLSVLVFDKAVDEYEKVGWFIDKDNFGNYLLSNNDYQGRREESEPYEWASIFAQIGNFHTYELPSHPELETKIIKAVQTFHTDHVLTGLPPRAQNYPDIQRLLSHPQGTIVTDDENFKDKCREYSELTRQLGSASPLKKRRDILKVEIMNQVNEINRDDWSSPPKKISVLDSNGGDELCSFSEDKNGQLSFRAKRA